MGDQPVQVKFEFIEVNPLQKQPSCTVHISPHNYGTEIDRISEKRSVTSSRKSTMDFPTSHQPQSSTRASPLISPNWGSYTQIWRFSHKFPQKELNVSYKILSSKNFQRQSRSAINNSLPIERYQHFGMGRPRYR